MESYTGEMVHQPKLISIRPEMAWVVLSVKNFVQTNIELRVESSAVAGDEESDDWEPVLWDDGGPMVFTKSGVALLPVCNHYIRMLLVGTLDEGSPMKAYIK
jgi:hypothetical protein